jgi:subtilisin family serine protease
MHPAVARRVLLLLLAVLFVPATPAGASKLNALARVALAQLRAGGDPAALKARGAAVDAEGRLDVFITGKVSRASLEAAGAIVRTEIGEVRTAFVPVSAIDAVAALPGVRLIEGATRLAPQLDVSVPATGLVRGPAPEFLGLSGEGVLVGNIDTGIDYDHEDFKDPSGHTRLVGIWDQTDGAGPSPTGFFYGTEWTPADIDAGVAREVDLTGHGTHCMGILGGDGSGTGGAVPPFTYVGMAPLASLLAIKSNLSSTGILDGANYFFQRAAALGMNGALNISLGSHYGPHDGTSALESGLSALVGPGRVVCAAAGNDRGSSTHARIFGSDPTANGNATLFIQGAGVGSAVVICGYYDSSEVINIRVTSPRSGVTGGQGTIVGPVAFGQANAPYPGVITPSGRIYVENGITTYPSGAREVYIELQAMSSQDDFHGVWTIRGLQVLLGNTEGKIDLWRFFGDPAISDFYAGKETSTLLVEPANATGVVSVAAYATKVSWEDCAGFANQYNPPFGTFGQLASFSSPGPTRDGRMKPDVTAPGCQIGSATSFDIPQVCSPATAYLLADDLRHTINQGTSMAVPHVTGAVALLMQSRGAVDPAFVKSYFAANATVDSNTGAVPNFDWGVGKLNLEHLYAVDVPEPAGTAALDLAPIRPNPARGDRLRLEFTLPHAQDVRIALVDVRGRIVATLARGARPAGPNVLAAALPARRAPGLYFVVLETDAGRKARRVLLID